VLVGLDYNVIAAFRWNIGVSAGNVLPKGELVAVTL